VVAVLGNPNYARLEMMQLSSDGLSKHVTTVMVVSITAWATIWMFNAISRIEAILDLSCV
jgi:hypothetical protein